MTSFGKQVKYLDFILVIMRAIVNCLSFFFFGSTEENKTTPIFVWTIDLGMIEKKGVITWIEEPG